MKYKRMIDEETWKAEDGADPVSVYIVCQEGSEGDQGIVSALRGDIDKWGKEFTLLNPKPGNGNLGVEERSELISSATWVIVVCSDVQALTGDTMFSYEENLSLFEAMKKGLQNITYLHTTDVGPVPCNGFKHISVTSNANWSITLRSLIQNRPRAIDGRMFTEFYSQLTSREPEWFTGLTDVSDTLSRPSRDSNKISWILKYKDGRSTTYVFYICGDSVKLESKEQESCRSVDVSVSCDLIDAEPKDYSTWEDYKDEDTEDTGDSCYDCGCCIFMNFFIYGYIAMSVLAASPVSRNAGYSEDLRSTYIPGLQVAHMVISALLSLTGILCCTMEKSKEWRVITIYHAIFTTVCLILQVVYFVDKLPHVLDVVVGGGVLSFCVYSNNLTVTNYFGAITKNSKCMITLRVIGFLIGVSLFIRFCIFTPRMFMLSNLSFKTTLVILWILFILELGFFRVLVRFIQYFVRLKFKKVLGSIAELVLLLGFMALWFGPSFFIY